MIELLSPAGNMDSLRSAVKGGANAVYLGLSQFNARMKAENFTVDNISETIEYCHLYGVKVYVTINISIKQSELSDLIPLLSACDDAGVDAFIVTDMSLLPLARQYAPRVALHASTQLGIHNLEGARYAERLGFCRVVLSRESRLDDIKAIKSGTSLEVEYFVHGAMCVSFSGGCLFSSVATGNSGNRGRCLQPCRKEYTETLTGSKGYMLSPKDQCLIDNIRELEMAGVDSLKIEGRMKSPEYVGLVVSKYRAVLDGVKLSDRDYSEIKRVYNRGGFNRGYAFSAKDDIMCKSVQGHIGEYVGKVLSCRRGKNYNVLTVQSKHSFVNGDGVKVFRGDREIGGFEVSVISNNRDVYQLYSKQEYAVGDSIHLTTDRQLFNEIDSWAERKLNITINGVFDIDKGIKLIAEYGEIKADFTDDQPFDKAVNRPATEEDISIAMSKCGDTPFEISSMTIDIRGDIFLPKSRVNNARRQLLDNLKRAIVCSYKCNNVQNNYHPIPMLKSKKLSRLVVCNPPEDILRVVKGENIDIVMDYDRISNFILKNQLIKNNIYIKLPKIALYRDIKMLYNILDNLPNDIGIYADNIYALEIARSAGRYVLGGIGLNIMNSKHAGVLGVNSFVASPELRLTDIDNLNNDTVDIAVYSYGYLPVMTFAHCPVQNITDCSCNSCRYTPFSFRDEYGEYQIRRYKCVDCYFTMYNSCCHNLSHIRQLDKYSAFLDFSLDNVGAKEIINSYLACQNVNIGVKYTEGNIYKGVK